MARDTSIAAYNTIKENGLLSSLRFAVYDFVFKNGPCTARQATKRMLAQGLNSGSISTRFSELRDLGVFAEVGYGYDRDTEQQVIMWDVTSRIPEKPVKKMSKTQLAVLKEREECAQTVEALWPGAARYIRTRRPPVS